MLKYSLEEAVVWARENTELSELSDREICLWLMSRWGFLGNRSSYRHSIPFIALQSGEEDRVRAAAAEYANKREVDKV